MPLYEDAGHVQSGHAPDVRAALNTIVISLCFDKCRKSLLYNVHSPIPLIILITGNDWTYHRCLSILAFVVLPLLLLEDGMIQIDFTDTEMAGLWPINVITILRRWCKSLSQRSISKAKASLIKTLPVCAVFPAKHS